MDLGIVRGRSCSGGSGLLVRHLRARLARITLLGSGLGLLALRIGFLWLVGYVFFVFHGLSFHLTPWSQAFINAIVKYTYDPGGRKGQKDVTVVLFREENLGHLGVQYPVPYGVHAEVLSALASYRPRAVFVDFAFIDAREDARALADALCGLGRPQDGPPIPVFVAAPAGAAVQKTLLGCAQEAGAEMHEPEGVSGVLTYATRLAPQGPPMAAFALAATNAAIGLDTPRPEGSLEIIWGKGVAPLNRKWMKCEEPSLPAGIAAMLKQGPLALKLACPYTRTITVGHLLNFSADRDIEDALRGRTVLYGAGFRLTGDQVDSPVYAQLPGVYLHAMAYDNLATFGNAYKRAARHGLGAKVTDAVLLLIASVILVRYPRRPAQPAATFAELKRKIRHGVITGAVTGVILLMIIWLGGFDIGLLAIFAAYVLYRWRVNGDRGFVLLVGITLVTALFYYYVMNLGPRNILAFLVFFEVVRHVQKHVKEAAERYVELRAREDHAPQGPLWRLTDALLSRYPESTLSANGRRETTHEAQESRTTR
jgi:CHASE2 domain-containing sensor protein